MTLIYSCEHKRAPTKTLNASMIRILPYCNMLGFYSRWILIFQLQKLNTVQLNTTSHSLNTAGESLVWLSVHLHARTVRRRIVRH
jgi:hypothetical protein